MTLFNLNLMEDNKIKVSIIMPTYNRANMIGNAIESIFRQNYTNWELLVIDNGSTDNTKEIINTFAITDARIKYHNVPKSLHGGLADYLNYGISHAEGDYIARLDDDDEWCDAEKIEKQLAFLEKNKDYVLVGSGAIMVNSEKKEIYRFLKRENDHEIRSNALYSCPFWHSTVLFRKKAALEVGGYQNNRFGEDWELWLKLGKIGKLYNFQEYFSYYLSDGQRFSVESQRFVGKTILKIIKRYRSDYPNYYKALVLNFLQYLFAFTPAFIKKRFQNYLSYIKRNYF